MDFVLQFRDNFLISVLMNSLITAKGQCHVFLHDACSPADMLALHVQDLHWLHCTNVSYWFGSGTDAMNRLTEFAQVLFECILDFRTKQFDHLEW